jgi:hypothetical protein
VPQPARRRGPPNDAPPGSLRPVRVREGGGRRGRRGCRDPSPLHAGSRRPGRKIANLLRLVTRRSGGSHPTLRLRHRAISISASSPRGARPALADLLATSDGASPHRRRTETAAITPWPSDRRKGPSRCRVRAVPRCPTAREAGWPPWHGRGRDAAEV